MTCNATGASALPWSGPPTARNNPKPTIAQALRYKGNKKVESTSSEPPTRAHAIRCCGFMKVASARLMPTPSSPIRPLKLPTCCSFLSTRNIKIVSTRPTTLPVRGRVVADQVEAGPVEAFGNAPKQPEGHHPVRGIRSQEQDQQVGEAVAKQAQADRGAGAQPAPYQSVGEEGNRNHDRAQPAVDGDRGQVVAGPPEEDREEGPGEQVGGGVGTMHHHHAAGAPVQPAR